MKARTIGELRRALAGRAWKALTSLPLPEPPPPVIEGKPIQPRREWGHHPGTFGREHPTSWAWPSYLDEARSPWLRTLREIYASGLSFPASISPEGGLLLFALARNIRPRVVVETGTWLGVSTMWLAAALADAGDGGVVHTFDLFAPIRKDRWRNEELVSNRRGVVEASFAKAGLADRIVVHQGYSSFELRAAHAALREAGGVQLALLDADHETAGASHDFWALEPVLAVGGYVIFHDVFPEYCGHEGPREVLDRINRMGAGVYERCELCLSPVNYGLGVVRRVG